MENEQITIEEWKALFEVAIRFRDQKSWEWMRDDMIFGVQNPENGMINYCIVLGNIGQYFGFSANLGTEGLEGLQKMNDINQNELDAIHFQNCIMASFLNRNDLNPRDYKLIKKLGLSFRGKNQWIYFRNYTPGFFPWFITREQVINLTHALEQGFIVAELIKQDPALLYSSRKNTYFVRVPEKKGKKIVWKSEWREPKPLKKKKIKRFEIDDISLHRIQNSAQRTSQVWEISIFFLPAPIQDNKKQRPYFPYMFLGVERNEGLGLFSDTFEHEDYQKNVFRNFIEFIERENVIPKTLMVTQEEIVEIFQPTAKKLGIQIKKIDKFKYLYLLREHLDQYMRK